MSRKLIVAGLAFAVVIAIVLGRDSEVDHEALIRAVINRAIAATEAHDLPGILEHVSDRFSSREMDKKGLKGLLFVQLRRGAWRKVFLTDADIDLPEDEDPKTARVRLAAVLATGREIEDLEDVIPTNAAKYRFDLAFEREADDEWRVTAATYEQIALDAGL